MCDCKHNKKYECDKNKYPPNVAGEWNCVGKRCTESLENIEDSQFDVVLKQDGRFVEGVNTNDDKYLGVWQKQYDSQGEFKQWELKFNNLKSHEFWTPQLFVSKYGKNNKAKILEDVSMKHRNLDHIEYDVVVGYSTWTRKK